MFWKQCRASLYLVEIKFKMASLFKNYWMQYFYLLLYPLWSWGISKLDSLEARGNHLDDISARDVSFKETSNSQTSFIVQRDILPKITQKNWLQRPNKWPQKKKKQDWRFNNCWFDKKRELLFGANNNPVLPETLQYLLITVVHTLSHWSTDKMIAFLNKYWWEILKRLQKVSILLVQFVQNTT